LVEAQSISPRRRDVGYRVRAAWASRATARHDGDDARLLRAAAREAHVHARDDPGLDHAPRAHRAPRSRTLAGRPMMTSDDLKERIEAIETGYEFMLAYAAQGRQTDRGAAAGRNVREYLDKMVAALDGLSPLIGACAKELDPELVKKGAAFFTAVDTDAR